MNLFFTASILATSAAWFFALFGQTTPSIPDLGGWGQVAVQMTALIGTIGAAVKWIIYKAETLRALDKKEADDREKYQNSRFGELLTDYRKLTQQAISTGQDLVRENVRSNGELKDAMDRVTGAIRHTLVAIEVDRVVKGAQREGRVLSDAEVDRAISSINEKVGK